MTMTGRSPSRARWDRRTLLSVLAASAALALTTGLRLPHGASGAARVAREIGRGRPAVREIGRRYLALAPDESDATRLIGLLFGAKDSVPPESPAALRRQIAAGRVRDFAAGDTILVDGWILARTEARLCALCLLA